MSHRILVVEDDKSVQTAVAYCLRGSGYTVLLASDGWEALERIRENSICLAILDLSLPRLDGFGILEHLQAEHARNPELEPVPTIILTAFAEENHQQRSFELGARRFIVKPFSPRELVAAVREVIGPSQDNQRPANQITHDRP